MRTVALALALALALTACDAIFGLHGTKFLSFDAPKAPDSPPPQTIPVSLEWQVANTNSSGVPSSAALISPIEPAPTVQIGPVNGMLGSATYDDATGDLEAPFTLAGSAYRIDYNLGTEQIEMQLDVQAASLYLPHLSRVGAPVVPASSGYEIAPMGLTGSGLQNPEIATSGVYTVTPVPAILDGEEVSLEFSNAKAMQGPLAAPETADGDWVLLLDWPKSTTTNPYTITGYAVTLLDLVADQLSTPQTEPVWQTTATAYSYDSNTILPAIRIQNAMVMLSSGSMPTFQVDYGILPSMQLVPFVAGNTVAPDQALLIPLYEDASTTSLSSLTVIDVDPAVVQQPRALLSEVELSRTSDGITLTSALQTITTDLTGTMEYPAPLATDEMFGGEPLDGSLDQSDVPIAIPTDSPLTLSWTPEGVSGVHADDYVVRLYEILDGVPLLVQTYQVLTPSVGVDSSMLQANHVYLFGITARTGIPGAQNLGSADYSMVDFPFSEATTFPATFKITN